MVYELWEDSEDDSLTFTTTANAQWMRQMGILGCHFAKKKWEVEADSWEEAMTKLHEHMDWKPYTPMEEDNE